MVLSRASLPGWCDPEAVYVARDTLLDLYSLPRWAKQGMCRDYPPSMFFPASGETPKDAKAVCARCPVRDDCLDYALSMGPSLEGVWAGTSKRERRHLGKTIASGGA